MIKRIYEIDQRECSAKLIPALADLYRRARGVELPIERFRWFYLENPSGSARVHLVREGNELVGMSVAVPHRCTVGRRGGYAWNTVDFCVLPAYRTLGLAIKLRRAVLAAAADAGIDLVFAHPARDTLRVHQRSGITHHVPNRRYVLPISYRSLAADRWPRGALVPVTRTVAALADGLAGRTVDGRLQARPVNWDEAGALLARLASRPGSMKFVVDDAYLQWRFARCPQYACQAFGCWVADRPLALAVVAVIEQTAWLKLIEPVPTPARVLAALTGAMLPVLRRQSVRTISAVVPQGHVLEQVLGQCGFWPQDDGSETIWQSAGEIPAPSHWNRLVSDRDV